MSTGHQYRGIRFGFCLDLRLTFSTLTWSLALLGPVAAQGPLEIAPGSLYSVVRVEHDDVLNMRAAPNPRSRIVKTIPPFPGRPFPATGRSERVGSSEWMEIIYEGRYGWVNAHFLAKRELPGTAGTRQPQQEPQYFGRLAVAPLADGRTMQVLETFGFTDSNGVRWEVPPGAKTDGASIPSGLWGMIGSPFSGKYREAAVIHDYYCNNRNRPWRDTHRVFYEAMLSSGVGPFMAKLMYAAVYRFGPRWYRDKSVCWGTCAGDNVQIEDVVITPRFDSGEFSTIKDYVERFPNASLEQVQFFIEETTNAYNELDSAHIEGVIADERTGKTKAIDGDAPINWMSLDY